MANKFAPDPSLAPANIDTGLLFRLVSTDKDRAAVLVAVEEYEAQQALHRDFAVPHLASPAREKLHGAGITSIDDAGFRTHYLEGRPSPQREQIDWGIDLRIVEQLREKVQPVIRRIRKAAVADLEASLPKGGHPDAALAQRYGLPAPQEGEVHRSIRASIANLRAALDEPINLSNNADRRGTLSNFFANSL